MGRRPRLALCIFGISYLEELHHWSGNYYSIDFKHSVDNYKNFLFNYFENLGYEIDVFIATNPIPEHKSKELIRAYRPKVITYHENMDDINKSRNNKIINALRNFIQYQHTNKIIYKHVLITRFDLLFQIPFFNTKFSANKLNIVSILEKNHFICDNFYLFPFHLSKLLLKIFVNHQNTTFHKLKSPIQKEMDIHYIWNEHKEVRDLSFYKIHRILDTVLYVLCGNARTFLNCIDGVFSHVIHNLFTCNKEILFYLKLDDPGPKEQEDGNFTYPPLNRADVERKIQLLEQTYKLKFHVFIYPSNTIQGNELVHSLPKRELYIDYLSNDQKLERCLHFFHNFVHCGQLIEHIIKHEHKNYSQFIFLRPDLLFEEDLPSISSRNQELIFAKGPNKPSELSDHFAIVPKKLFHSFFYYPMEMLKQNVSQPFKNVQEIYKHNKPFIEKPLGKYSIKRP